MLTREEVGDGEDAERPPHGARLGLLDQIVHALHPLPHLGLRGGARPRAGGRYTGAISSGDGVLLGIRRRGHRRRRRRRPSEVAAPRETRRRFLFPEFFFLPFRFWIFRDVPELNVNGTSLFCSGPYGDEFVCGTQVPGMWACD